MAKFTATTRISHGAMVNGQNTVQTVEEGGTIELSAEEATPLLESGAIVLPAKPTKAAKGGAAAE